MTDLDLLILKLKRHKIRFKKRGNTLIIKGNKLDFSVLVISIILPFLCLLGIAFCKQLFGVYFFEVFKLKGILLTLFLAVYILVNGLRLFNKWVYNRNEKIFSHESIIIQNGKFRRTLFKSDIADFGYNIDELNGLVHMANLVVIDKEANIYDIFGIEDESLQYIENDIKWYFHYFMKHFNLKISDLEDNSSS